SLVMGIIQTAETRYSGGKRMIKIVSLTLGIAATNCYIVGDTDRKQAIVIDAVDDAQLILNTAKKQGWEIKLILATHSHFDHVLASAPLKKLTNAPFYIHHEGEKWLKSLPQQGMMFTGKAFPDAAIPDRLLTSEPETITLGAITLETLFTPGHAPDHIAFYLRSEKTVFSGDTLFAGSIGRTDLPGGNYPLLIKSITEKLFPLGDDTRVLAGHMEATTIGKEKRTNPYLID
ncbi:MAG TPA: MBL fold metallo-hydrolase, partial [Aggregatilineales bacterium]|nr:MBL fold metallo-hydrolase [Aggregatilineales bacterium]